MKMLVISNYSDSLCGFREPLIVALSNSGVSVCAVSPKGGNDEYVGKRLSGFGVRHCLIDMQRTGVNPVRDLQSFWQLYRLMRREKPQAVLPYTVKPVVWGLLAARLAGVPHRFALITGLGYAFAKDRKGFVSTVVHVLYRMALRHASKVFFQNPDDEALLRELGILPVSVPSVVVNGSGIDVTQFVVAPLPDKPVFLLIARLLGDKGIREYVAAARKVKKVSSEAIFKLVGWVDGNPEAIAQHELDVWVSEGIVEYLGRLSDVRPAIASASVHVLPSYYPEGTPRTNLEAMSMGRAIITTDSPGCRETVIDGENGFLVPVKDSEKLAEAMLRFIEQPELVLTMGRRSREIAEEKYDVHKVNAVMLQEMGIGTA